MACCWCGVIRFNGVVESSGVTDSRSAGGGLLETPPMVCRTTGEVLAIDVEQDKIASSEI